MKANRLFLIPFLFLCAVMALPALDGGGTIDNLSALDIETQTGFRQIDRLTLWADTSIGESFYTRVQGSYTFSLNKPYLFDLERLLFRGSFLLGGNSRLLLGFTAGRFFVEDFSGQVLSHTLDGIRVNLDIPLFKSSLFFGSSALLFNDPSRIVMTRHDAADKSDSARILASPRLIGMVNLRFIDLFLQQDLSVSYLMQIDLRADSELTDQTAGGKLNSHYFGVGLGGALIPDLFWDSFGYFSIGSTLANIGGSYAYSTILSWTAGAGIRWYPEKKLYSRLLFRGIFTSGDADNATFLEGNTFGNSTLFVPIAAREMDTVFSPQSGNLIIAELHYALKPLAPLGGIGGQFQTELMGYLFLRPTQGGISESYNTASQSYYVGTEIDLALRFRPASDLGLSLTGGVFIPNNSSGGVFLSTQKSLTTSIKLSASFSF